MTQQFMMIMSEHIHLQASGKPIGLAGAAVIARLTYLSQYAADGWVTYTVADCQNDTGLTKRQQMPLFELLVSAGIISYDRHEEQGKRRMRLNIQKLHNVTSKEDQKLQNVTSDEITSNKMSLLEVTKCTNQKLQNVTSLTRTRHAVIPEESQKNPERIRTPNPLEGADRAKKQNFIPPTVEEMRAFMEPKGFGWLAGDCHEHYTETNWCSKKGSKLVPLLSWQAACRTFMSFHRDEVDDGRPCSAEAWIECERSLRMLGVELTLETSVARGKIKARYKSGDEKGAEFAFREIYRELVKAARKAGTPVKRCVQGLEPARAGPTEALINQYQRVLTDEEREVGLAKAADIRQSLRSRTNEEVRI